MENKNAKIKLGCMILILISFAVIYFYEALGVVFAAIACLIQITLIIKCKKKSLWIRFIIPLIALFSIISKFMYCLTWQKQEDTVGFIKLAYDDFLTFIFVFQFFNFMILFTTATNVIFCNKIIDKLFFSLGSCLIICAYFFLHYRERGEGHIEYFKSSTTFFIFIALIVLLSVVVFIFPKRCQWQRRVELE